VTVSRRTCVAGLFATTVIASTARAQGRQFIDSIGRPVILSGAVARVMAAGPPASVLVYALAPDALVGPQLPPDAKPFLLPAVRDLPASDRLTGSGATIDAERIKDLKPDLIVDFGSTASNYAALAEKVQAATGLPYALIGGKLDTSAASLRMLGEMLGRRERADALAAYAEKTLEMVDGVLARVPADKRPRIFVARGADGLQSAVMGSGLTEVVERVGALNVAQAAVGSMPGRGGAVEATPAQVAAWKPDVVVALDKPAYEAMRKALPGTKVLLAPALPWGWLGEPPSVNRLIGLRWLASAFYPDDVKLDLRSEAREFHRLFYGVVPSDAELTALLEGTTG
jgi:iron complex transport system substrate-binding protein